MLQRKITTKRDKKIRIRKKSGLVLILLGLLFIATSLFLIKFFTHDPLFVSPLSQIHDSTDTSLVKELKKNKVEYQEIKTNNDLSYLIVLKENQEVIIDPKKDISLQLSSLQLIIAQLKIEGKAFSRLDFRYEKPVIVF